MTQTNKNEEPKKGFSQRKKTHGDREKEEEEEEYQ
jgi:hypothetical protein